MIKKNYVNKLKKMVEDLGDPELPEASYVSILENINLATFNALRGLYVDSKTELEKIEGEKKDETHKNIK